MSEHPAPLGLMTDLVAFEVEGSGHYLVPLPALSGYLVPVGDGGAAGELRGWGWQLPVVRWNTFHSSQIDAQIALAPAVVARLAAHHFVTTTSPDGAHATDDIDATRSSIRSDG